MYVPLANPVVKAILPSAPPQTDGEVTAPAVNAGAGVTLTNEVGNLHPSNSPDLQEA